MPIPPTALAIQALERKRARLVLTNRILCWVLPIAAVGVVADVARWSVQLRKPVEIVQPDLREMERPLANLPILELSPTLFESPQIAPASAAGEGPAVAVKGGTWKVKGITLGQTKRAFLEGPEGKGVWVTEGEKVEDSLVKEIRERSVILEEEGKEYELRL